MKFKAELTIEIPPYRIDGKVAKDYETLEFVKEQLECLFPTGSPDKVSNVKVTILPGE